VTLVSNRISRSVRDTNSIKPFEISLIGIVLPIPEQRAHQIDNSTGVYLLKTKYRALTISHSKILPRIRLS
jgi:hypothetical protein